MPYGTEGKDDFVALLPRFWNNEVREHLVFSPSNRALMFRWVRSLMKRYATDLAPDLAEDIVQTVNVALSVPGSFKQDARSCLREYIKHAILSAIHVVRAENARPTRPTRIVNDKARVRQEEGPFRPKLVELDRTIFNNNGEQTSIGDTIASPFNPIEKLQEDMGARQTIRAIAAAGKPELASALTLMYEEEISLNAAAKRTRVHYTTLHRQREWVKQNFALLAA